MDYLRYDRLYSTNEVVILFCGSREKSQTLDNKLNDFNAYFNKRQLKGVPQRQRIKPKTFTIDSIPDNDFVQDRSVSVYSIDLGRLAKDGLEKHAYDILIAELDAYARKAMVGINRRRGLPLMIEASDRVIAERYLIAKNAEMQDRYFRKPKLKNEEISIHLSALFNKFKRNRKRFVFDVDKSLEN